MNGSIHHDMDCQLETSGVCTCGALLAYHYQHSVFHRIDIPKASSNEAEPGYRPDWAEPL